MVCPVHGAGGGAAVALTYFVAGRCGRTLAWQALSGRPSIQEGSGPLFVGGALHTCSLHQLLKPTHLCLPPVYECMYRRLLAQVQAGAGRDAAAGMSEWWLGRQKEGWMRHP